jgi:polysaccharide export outer membrane protein
MCETFEMRSCVRALLLILVLIASGLDASAQEAYRVGPSDVLGITVWGHTELSGKFVVTSQGSITFPLLGALPVASRTVSEIQSDLSTKLADGFLKKPQVNVDVVEYQSQKIYVMGEVRTPGPVPLTRTTSVLEALARVGSLTEQAGGEVMLLRPATGALPGPVAPNQEGVTTLGHVSVQQLRTGSLTVNLALQDGDTIFVPRSESIFVLGMVNSPGAYTIENGVTTVMRAISAAGGVSQLGSTGRVRVTRIVDGKKVELKAKLDDVLKPGDTVVVGTRLF